MKKFYLLLTIVFIIGCEKDNLETPSELSAKKTTFENLPADLQAQFQRNELNIGELKGNTKIKIKANYPINFGVNNKNKRNYTFQLEMERSKSKQQNLYFENLVINETSDGYEYIIIRYEPDWEKFNSSMSMENYVGNISFYNINKEKLYDFSVSNDVKSSNTVCYLKIVSTFCTGSVYAEYGYSCSNQYTVRCTSGSNGNNNDNSWENGDGYNEDTYTGGDSGDDSGSGEGINYEERNPDTVYTNPNFQEPEEIVYEIENNIEDPCAALIFSQLQLMSMDYELPPNTSNPDGFGDDLEFSNAILNIFNESQKYKYIVEEDPTLSVNQSGTTGPGMVYIEQEDKYEITTRFNPYYFQQATDLSIARTVIHESVHAYLLYSVSDQPMGNIRLALTAYIEDNGMSNQVNNLLHHNFMAQFVDAIAYNLWIWDLNFGNGGNLGWLYYKDLAWGGLSSYTDNQRNLLFYQEYLDHTTPNERTRIEKTIQDEANNSSDSSQSGNKNDCQ
jgi:hypothetical protein